jgi:hypothetical protein
MMDAFRCAVAITVVCLLAACVTREVLEPKNPVVQAGIDLSGRWQLQESGAGAARAPARSGKGNSAVSVFLEFGENLKVTQTEFAVFVSFDRSIVEEYRFGENRIISVGPIHANRVSGWESSGYIIETLDEEGDKLIERYRLDTDKDELLRQIIMIVNRETRLDLTQRFVRR